jgi:hypothetical protein
MSDTPMLIFYEAADLDAAISIDGLGILTMLTDKGQVAVTTRRDVLESLMH